MKKIGIRRKRFVNVAMLLSMLCLCMGAMLGAKADAKAAYPDEFSMSISVTEYYDRGLEIVKYINDERARVGAAPLTIDADLQDIAMQRATEQLFVGGHTRPNGESGITADWTGTGKFAAENAMHGGSAEQYTALNLYNTWKNSKGHYDAMVYGGFKTVGVGVITGVNNYGGGAIIAFGYNLQNNVNSNIISGTCTSMRTVPGLRMSECSFGGNGTYGGAYLYDYEKAEPLYMLLSGKAIYVRGKDLEVFNIQSLTTDVATVSSDGYITVHKSGTVTLRAVLRSNPSLSTTSTFTVKLPEKEPEEVKERVGLTVKVAKGSYVYTGKEIRPKVKVYGQDENGSLVPWIYGYTVSYKDNKAAGTARVTVRGKGIYKELTGSATFTIRPGKVKFSSPKSNGKGKATLGWKKAPEAQGYEVQYGTKKKLKTAETERIPGKGKTGVTLKKLKSKKTYYVRIRSYKKVGGKTVYSPWSEIKKVKVK